MGPALIHDYGIIGNGRSAALVSLSGSIDWLCWPRFDSPSLLAALLDRGAGGHFSIAPTAPFTATRAYEDESNVLVTTFTTADGDVRLTDLMPVMSEEDKATTLFPEHEILRVCAVRARPRRAARRVPSASGLRAPDRSDPRHDATSVFGSRTDRASTRCAPIGRWRRPPPTDVEGRFTLGAGERATFSLAFDHAGPAVLPPLEAADAAVAAHHRVVAAVGVALHLRRAVPPRGHPQRAGAEAAQLRTVGRDRGGADDVAARADRRRSQLGLPLLLDPRRGADGQLAVRSRVRGRIVGVLRLAAAQHAAHAAGAARPLRRLRRRPDRGGDARSPAGLPGVASGAHPQRRRGPAAAGRLRRAGRSGRRDVPARPDAGARDAGDDARDRRLRVRALARARPGDLGAARGAEPSHVLVA